MNEDKKIATIVETSLNEVIGGLSSVIFFSGCNLNCNYCYNKELIHPHLATDKSQWKTYDELKKFITKDLFRFKNMTTGKSEKISDWVVFSGGEALWLYQNEVFELNKIAKSKGFKTKLFTNGTLLEPLKKGGQLFDEISLDIKYYDPLENNKDDQNKVLGRSLDYSIKIKKALEIIQSKNIPFEIRTVVFKPFINESQLINISTLLKNYNPQRWILTPIKFPDGGLNDPTLGKQNEIMSFEIHQIIDQLNLAFPTIIYD